jgi:mono/diheme cytochrome c family protein
MRARLGLLPVLVLLVACERTEVFEVTENDAETGRWYSSELLGQGQQVFSQNCASCHGEQAQGLEANWRQRLADGSLPPPPLNGTAHAWHHPLSVLVQVISDGGIALGGKMPAFDEILSEEQKRAAIAYFQSFWSDEIYQQWLQMGGVQ